MLFRKCLGVSLCLKERTPAPSRQSEGSFRARARNPVRGCFASLSMTIAMSFRTPSRVMPSTFFGHCERQRGIHNIVCHGKSGFFTTLRSVQNDETEKVIASATRNPHGCSLCTARQAVTAFLNFGIIFKTPLRCLHFWGQHRRIANRLDLS